jgi:hypothetical protein
VRRLSILSLVVLISAFLYSCNKDSKAVGLSQTQAIVGRWTLTQQKVVEYVDGVVKTDTTYNAAPNNIARAQFNRDGTYSSVSVYSSEAIGSFNLSQPPVTTADSTSGIYTFSGNRFSVSAPLAGLGSGSIAFAESVSPNSNGSPLGVFSAVSNSIVINQLTLSKLNLHTVNVYTLTNNNVSHTYRNEADYYYEK